MDAADIREAEFQHRAELIAAGNICRHGRANGVSNWDRPFCDDCQTEDYQAALLEEMESLAARYEAEEEEVTCAICDGLGHGQPGYGPCPRFEVDLNQRHATEEEEKRADSLRLVDPDDIPF